MTEPTDGGDVPISTVPFDLDKYRAWERNYIADSAFVDARTGEPMLRGLCHLMSTAACEAFPELFLIRGIVVRRGWHWWCVASDGTLIDPTRGQFDPPPKPEDYLYLNESTAHFLPTGKCPGCGEEIFHDSNVCSLECADDVAADMGMPKGWGSPRIVRPEGEAEYRPIPRFRFR